MNKRGSWKTGAGLTLVVGGLYLFGTGQALLGIILIAIGMGLIASE